MMSQARQIELHYRIGPAVDAWVLPEVPVPESRDHDLLARYLVQLLEAYIAARGLDAIVARNLAVRWIEAAPRVGLDPDVCLIEPAPPADDRLSSLRVWEPGRSVPRLAIEIVSSSHPYKDYAEIQDKYAACGVPELWVLDPQLIGPKRFGGPVPLAVWMPQSGGSFARVHAGEAPFFSPALDAWVRVADGDTIISNDEAGLDPWLTGEQIERATKEAERAAGHAERAARLAAEKRVRELEAELARRK